MIIQWPDDDQSFLVSLPEWEGRVFNPVTHGESYEEAIRQALEALEALVSSARQGGEPLPAPQVILSGRA
jgi:predicted RNase H-like HicB family nuclease